HKVNLIHRDVKPANMLWDHQANCWKLADFGLVCPLEGARVRVTREGHILGTPQYMAPEQIKHGDKVDHRTDIYSLGVVLYEALTGQTPYGTTHGGILVYLQHLQDEPSSLSNQKRNIPEELELICSKCLEKEPAKRYQTADELARDL